MEQEKKDTPNPEQRLFTDEEAQLKQTEPEQDAIARYASDLKIEEMEGYQKAIKKARTALYVAAAVVFLSEMLAMARSDAGFDAFSFGFGTVMAGIFITLALWTKKKPHTAVVTGLIVYLAYVALVVLVNGLLYGSEGYFKGLVSGIIWKIFILVNLIAPLKDAKALQDAMKEREREMESR
jgi:hypothetical protein